MKLCWITILWLVTFDLSAGGLSDPTRPDAEPEFNTGKTAETVSKPVLTSIISGNSRCVAVIDGRSYSENDWVSGYQIKQITRRQVVLFKDEKMIELVLPTAMEEIEVVL